MNFLITGVNGFLGSNIARVLLDDGHKVFGLEKSISNNSRIDNLDIELYDIKNFFSCNQKIDAVIHTATLYGRDNESFKEIIDSNFNFPIDLANYCSENNVKYFINIDTILDKFTNIYTLTKKQFLEFLIFISKQKKINIVNLKLEHFYGHDSSKKNFLKWITHEIITNKKNIPLTNCEQKRDFLHIKDLILAIKIIIQNLSSDSFTEYEIGFGKSYKLKEILNFIKKESQSSCTFNFGKYPYRENELMESKVNNTKIKKLGWKPKTTIYDGLKEIIKKMKNE